MIRLPACESTRKRIADLCGGEPEIGELVREAIRLIVEEALEAEVANRLGREYYERSGVAGHRNGNRRGQLKCADSVIEYSAPHIAGTPAPWHSEVQAALGLRAEELMGLALKMYARGVSVREIKAAFSDRSGRCVLSGTAACYVCKRLQEVYQAFASRNLSQYKVRYLFVEDIAKRLHLEQPRETALAAWGITETGSKVLLGLAPATRNFRKFLIDLRARGLSDRALLISFGGADSHGCRNVPVSPVTSRMNGTHPLNYLH